MRIGIDLGGTKIEALALDQASAELVRIRIATPVGDYQGTILGITRLVTEIEAKTGQRGTVGVASPGCVSPATGLIKNANSTVLNGQPLDRDLAQALGRPVRIANDADCFALSEATDGAAQGAASVFGVILGTGVGGGLVYHGGLVRGPNGIAGEWGHNPLPWPSAEELPGPSCYCGRSGCIETFLSGPGFRRDHARRSGSDLPAEAIAAAAAAHDPAAAKSLDIYIDRLARGLATVINLYDPEVIVLGGGLSNLAALYERVPRRWGAYVFSDRVDTRLVPPRHGDASGVRGAAWLWPQARAD